MKKMTDLTRREFLKMSSRLSVAGAAGSTFGLQLATMSSASAASTYSDYKALVCVFLLGGNDSNNMLLATDSQSWDRYFDARTSGTDPIALMPPNVAAIPLGGTSSITQRRINSLSQPEAWGGVLPITPDTSNPIPYGTEANSRSFAIHPFMEDLLPIWDEGRLAMISNVGTLITPITRDQFQQKSVPYPRALMSHNDQQSLWQSGGVEGTNLGWGGQMADQLLSANGDNTVFTAISASGNAVWLSGQDVIQYQINTSDPTSPGVSMAGLKYRGNFGSANMRERFEQIIRDTSSPSLFAQDLGTLTSRSIDSSSALNEAFATGQVLGIPEPSLFNNPITGQQESNSLAKQLAAVARTVASASTLGVRRQVFFVTMGGFDTHNNENSVHSVLMARMAHAFSYLDNALSNVGGSDMRNQVTTFTSSDFSRTFTQNNDGTDHAWGGHHMIMGGAVRGRDIYGQYPTLGVDQGNFRNPDLAVNAFIPTLSVDQYASTLGRWFGVSDSALRDIFPNLGNFDQGPNFMYT